MDYGLYVSASGAATQSQRMEVLSHNLANVDTPGFKEELAVVQARASRAIQDGLDVPSSQSINNLSGGVSIVETMTRFTPGPVKSTGSQWDMAIDGDGFFVVENDGEQFLTRAGNFRLAPSGQLLTAQGFNVLSADGTPITIDPNLRWEVQQDGFLAGQDGSGVYIGLAKPSSPDDLMRTGENLFRPVGPIQSVPANQRRVLGGYLESSAVSPTQSMMELIETSRAYEANIRMIQSQDQLTGSLISRLLRTR